MTVNYRSDFKLRLTSQDAEGHAVSQPPYPWRAVFHTAGSESYTAGIGFSGASDNVVIKDDGVYVIFSRHGLPPGKLHMEFQAYMRDGDFPCGTRKVATTDGLDVELVTGKGDDTLEPESVGLILPAVTYHGGPGIDISENVISLNDAGKKALFIDMWNGACTYDKRPCHFGRYNEQTGFFELNGITDITYTEALKIYRMSQHTLGERPPRFNSTGGAWPEVFRDSFCRTYFPFRWPSFAAGDWEMAFRGNTIVEALNFISGYGNALGNFPNLYSAFMGCVKLRSILCHIGHPGLSYGTFKDCESLEYVNFTMYMNNNPEVSLQWSPRLRVDCVGLIVSQARPRPGTTATSTLTLHPEVYGKVPDRIFAEASAKGITISTTT